MLWLATTAAILFHAACMVLGHQAKDLDDSILYQIDFEFPKFENDMELKGPFPKFYTHDKEMYECLIPQFEDKKEEKHLNEPELSPYALLQPIFTSPGCSYRIEAYWSYEICHGRHVRQYHEEREGKIVKFQEYYLGTWNEDKTQKLLKSLEENRKAGIKYKTTKIDNVKYPYFEVEMTDGTLCEIINAPRTTSVRYVCYPHGKNEIYSFKETSSCNYEAIILTSALCMTSAFHPEETKMLSIKCFNSPTKPVPPLSMLKEELDELDMLEEDIPGLKKVKAADPALFYKVKIEKYEQDKEETQKASGNGIQTSTEESPASVLKTISAPVVDITPVKEFISGKNCLTGGTGWWKYEFCYGKHVRQFHKDKRSEVELYLGFFSEQSHKQWVKVNPEKGAKRPGYGNSIWHHYDMGSYCDRTGMQREVDVKLTCTPASNSMTTVSMYLLEPKTCQYILVVESPVICDIIKLADEYGLVQDEKLQSFLQSEMFRVGPDRANVPTNTQSNTKNMPHYDKTGANAPTATQNQQLADENA